MTKQLILGSLSPRRREILNFFSVPFQQMASHFSEEQVPLINNPILYAETLSKGKAESIARLHKKAVVLTADTIVFKDGKIINKPKNENEAFELLKSFNGGWQSVFTAVTVQLGEEAFTETEQTKVLFHQVSEKELLLYHRAFKSEDKAGGYGIQMAGSIIVKRLEGCFYNVMGLPITTTSMLLKKMGIDLWEFLT